VHALACACADGHEEPMPPSEALAESSFRAGRDGLGATVWWRGALRPLRAVAADALALSRPYARELDGAEALREIDRIVHEGYLARGGYPSTLNYHGFPKSLCTSVNEVILHGIPDSRPLANGDIVNLDVTIYLDGVHGDCSVTFFVGDVDEASRRLVRITRECMEIGIAAVRPGRPISDVGRAIEKHAAAHGYGVVRAFCGHGIGEDFHMEPQVLHYYEPRVRTIMEEGMIFTIEPMLTAGRPEHIVWPDGWTAVTVDGGRAAQFEHTVLVTRDGAEILTVTGDAPGQVARAPLEEAAPT
jgi:methionyl aminopeptidase